MLRLQPIAAATIYSSFGFSMTELGSTGRTYHQVANILNEESYLPRRGPKFTHGIVRTLLRGYPPHED